MSLTDVAIEAMQGLALLEGLMLHRMTIAHDQLAAVVAAIPTLRGLDLKDCQFIPESRHVL
jgi:hypothetical protein